MQLIVDIENKNTADKVIHFLKSLKNDGVEMKQKLTIDNQQETTKYTDEYIESNWQRVVSEALSDYDSTYEKSFQYKIDRADFQEIKGKM